VEPDKLYTDPELAQFYDLENGWAEDLDYCRILAEGCASVLDLGCGSGLFAASLTQGEVVGVDPAAAMLDIAARRPGGDRVQWVQGDARMVRLDRCFDLVVLTGHAFQVFLTDEDRTAVLQTIAHHLSPEGRFIFDSRNPTVAQWRAWTADNSKRHIEHPVLGRVLAWNDASFDPATGIVTYGTHYKLPSNDRPYSAHSKIAFPSQERLASLIDAAGLTVERWLGHWSGSPYLPDSHEIIPVGTLRR
jgi:SAM-dependent methyltransferase